MILYHTCDSLLHLFFQGLSRALGGPALGGPALGVTYEKEHQVKSESTSIKVSVPSLTG